MENAIPLIPNKLCDCTVLLTAIKTISIAFFKKGKCPKRFIVKSVKVFPQGTERVPNIAMSNITESTHIRRAVHFI